MEPALNEVDMDVDTARQYLLGKPEAMEDYPFGPDVAVMKVRGKMFATLGEEQGEGRMNLKCDPDRALELREQYAGVEPGYHMSKVHWNTVSTQSDVSDALLLELIDHSYALIRASLTKKLQAELAELEAAQGA